MKTLYAQVLDEISENIEASVRGNKMLAGMYKYIHIWVAVWNIVWAAVAYIRVKKHGVKDTGFLYALITLAGYGLYGHYVGYIQSKVLDGCEKETEE